MDDFTKQWSGDYLFIPMAILCKVVLDLQGTLNDALYYCFYYRYTKLEGSQAERFEEIQRVLKIKYPNPLRSYNRGKAIFDSIPEKSPKASIKRDLVFEFLERPKNEFQIVCFLAFAALKSMIQRKGYERITNNKLIRRMAYVGKSDQYRKRYHIDKLKRELQLKWKLNLYATNMRGYYASFTMSLKKLAIHAEAQKKKNQIEILKQAKVEARIEALRYLGIKRDEQPPLSNNAA